VFVCLHVLHTASHWILRKLTRVYKIVIPVNKCHTFAVDIPEFQQHERKLQSIEIIKRPGFYRNFM